MFGEGLNHVEETVLADFMTQITVFWIANTQFMKLFTIFSQL